MSNKQYAVIGFLAPVIFWITYFTMAAQRPGYSFLTKAISELGSVDAPNKWTWNILGYILPGICISVFSIGLYIKTRTADSGKLPFLGIFLSGVFMAISGVFPGDFDDKKSLTMLLHTIGSFGSYVFFLIGAFTLPTHLKKSSRWATTLRPLMTMVWLTILFGSWPFVFPEFPAVGQRLVFAFYFLWIALVAYRLYNLDWEMETRKAE